MPQLIEDVRAGVVAEDWSTVAARAHEALGSAPPRRLRVLPVTGRREEHETMTTIGHRAAPPQEGA